MLYNGHSLYMYVPISSSLAINSIMIAYDSTFLIYNVLVEALPIACLSSIMHETIWD